MLGGWTAPLGLLNLAMVRALGVEGKVYGGMLAILPEKIASTQIRRKFTDVPQFPMALRDVAVVIDEATPAEDVRKQLAKLGRAAVGTAFALETVQVFDVYRGAGLPDGKKSVAFSLVFRAADRTLTDDEVNAVFQKVQDEIVKTNGWTIRK